MTCYRPKPAWRDSVPSSTGKYPLKFAKRGTQLDNDYMIPCRKCVGCRADHARNNGVRLYHETLSNPRNCMVTLTYAPETLPPGGKLSKPDIQKFIKRLRKLSNRPIKYFAAGEYGEQTRRPHYHVCIFNEDFLGGTNCFLHDRMWVNPRLDEIWGLGGTTVVPMEFGSALYVAGYVQKKANDQDTFNLMSKGSIRQADNATGKGPIGYEWLSNNIDLFGNRHDIHIDGTRLPIPGKYYDWRPAELDWLSGMKIAIEEDYDSLKARELAHKAKLQIFQQQRV